MAGIGLGLGVQFAAGGSAPAPFDPLTLFSGGQNGAIYDPSETSHMYQLSSGETAVSNGDPVGMVLDGRFGYIRESEELSNTGFDSGAGWTLGNATISGGTLNLAGGGVASTATQSLTTAFVSTDFYEVEYEVTSVSSSGTLRIVFTGGIDALGVSRTITVPGVYREIIGNQGTSSNNQFRFNGGTTLQCSITSVSCKKVPGRHLVQSTSAARPTYGTNGAQHWLNGDGVDNYMASNSKSAIFNGGGYMSCAVLPAAGQTKGIMSEQSGTAGNRVVMYFDSVTATNPYYANYAPTGTDFFIRNATPPSIADGCFSISSDGSTATGRYNGAIVGTATSTGNFSSITNIEILRQNTGGLYFSGRWYAGIIVDDILDSDTIAQADAWVAAKAGLTL